MAAYGLGQAYLCGSRPAAVPAAWLSEICTHAQRVRGPFSIYMTFGGVLFLGVLFFLAYLANVPWRRAWWMLPARRVTVAALAFTYSRNAWLGLAAGALALVLTAQRTLRIVAVLAAVLALGAVALPGGVAERAAIRRQPRGPNPARPGGDVAVGLSMIADHPLLGVGPGEVRTWYQHYRRPEAVRPSTGHLHNSRDPDRRRARAPRSRRVDLALGRLLPGGMAVPGPARAGNAPMRRALVCASLAGVAGFLVAGLFEHNFGDAEVATVVLALMAQPWVVARELGGVGHDRRRALGLEARPADAALAAGGASPAPCRYWEGFVSCTASRAAAAASRTAGSSSCQAAWRKASDATWASGPSKAKESAAKRRIVGSSPRRAPPRGRESLAGRTGKAPGGPSSASRRRTPEASPLPGAGSRALSRWTRA